MTGMDGDGIGRIGDRPPLREGLLAACLVLSSAVAIATEGEWRWRVIEIEDRISLVVAETDAGTDNFGSLRFWCNRASGEIKVEGEADEEARRVIADLIARDAYPQIKLVPSASNSGSLLQLSYSEMTGWLYGFDITAADPTFDNFKRTGTFQFKIGETLLRHEFKVGLENIAKFQAACRKPPPR